MEGCTYPAGSCKFYTDNAKRAKITPVGEMEEFEITLKKSDLKTYQGCKKIIFLTNPET